MVKNKKVAVIGAGWTGIGCLRMLLKDKSYELVVYEGRNAIGGTWHPENNYAGLKLHTPASTIEYFDFPLPDNIDRYERLYSSQVFNYVNEYCDFHQFKKHILFKKWVKSVNYNSQTKKSTLHYEDENGVINQSGEFDYVVYTHGYCDNNIPQFKNSSHFNGKIYHSFSVSRNLIEEWMDQNKKIVIVGGSKTATDFILQFYDLGYKVDWLVREPYWFFNYTQRRKWLKPAGSKLIYKIIFLSGLFLSEMLPNFSLRVWKWFHLIDTYGAQRSHFKKFHFGLVDESQLKILKSYYQQYGIESEIEEFDENAITLTNGKKIDADIVIACTGSGPSQLQIELKIDDKQFDAGAVTRMFRSRVIPQIPNLIFTAYHQFSMGTVDGLLQANWIDFYIKKNLNQEYLEKHATQFDKPFFHKAALFDSGSYVIPAIGKMYLSFFISGEIPIFSFLKWFLDSHFDGNIKISPFVFGKHSRKFPLKNALKSLEIFK